MFLISIHAEFLCAAYASVLLHACHARYDSQREAENRHGNASPSVRRFNLVLGLRRGAAWARRIDESPRLQRMWVRMKMPSWRVYSDRKHSKFTVLIAYDRKWMRTSAVQDRNERSSGIRSVGNWKRLRWIGRGRRATATTTSTAAAQQRCSLRRSSGSSRRRRREIVVAALPLLRGVNGSILPWRMRWRRRLGWMAGIRRRTHPVNRCCGAAAIVAASSLLPSCTQVF
jgi:hypothetical protein